MALTELAVEAFGQSVYLKATSVESRKSMDGEREEVLNITVKNMAPAAYEYTVEWMFMGVLDGARGNPILPVYAAEKKVPLDKNANTVFEVRSPKLKSPHEFHGDDGKKILIGLKSVSYVVRVRLDEKILAVESPNLTLKQKFQDLKAKWGVPESPESPKGKKRFRR
jgi:hypothetical protein